MNVRFPVFVKFMTISIISIFFITFYIVTGVIDCRRQKCCDKNRLMWKKWTFMGKYCSLIIIIYCWARLMADYTKGEIRL